jgi:hypothetical protein
MASIYELLIVSYSNTQIFFYEKHFMRKTIASTKIRAKWGV